MGHDFYFFEGKSKPPIFCCGRRKTHLTFSQSREWQTAADPDRLLPPWLSCADQSGRTCVVEFPAFQCDATDAFVGTLPSPPNLNTEPKTLVLGRLSPDLNFWQRALDGNPVPENTNCAVGRVAQRRSSVFTDTGMSCASSPPVCLHFYISILLFFPLEAGKRWSYWRYIDVLFALAIYALN